MSQIALEKFIAFVTLPLTTALEESLLSWLEVSSCQYNFVHAAPQLTENLPATGADWSWYPCDAQIFILWERRTGFFIT